MRGRLRTVLVMAGLCVLVAVPAAEAHTISYDKARKAVQRKADRFAGERTHVNALIRTSKHRYYAQARWEQIDPDGCKGCDFDPYTFEMLDMPTTEYCSAELAVRFASRRSRRLITRIIGHTCF